VFFIQDKKYAETIILAHRWNSFILENFSDIASCSDLNFNKMIRFSRNLRSVIQPIQRQCCLSVKKNCHRTSDFPNGGLKLFSTQIQTKIIDGKSIATEIQRELKTEVKEMKEQYGDKVTPGLAVVLVGNRPDSEKYVSMKKKTAKSLGFKSVERVLPEEATTEEVRKVVDELNADENIDGILVQLPLPEQVDQKYILEAIDVQKDVDGFHSSNFGSLARKGEDLRHKKKSFSVEDTRNAACTPLGSIVLLERSGVNLEGKNVVVLGRSNIVGLPVALMCLHRNATVTICHSRTKDLAAKCKEADVLIAAIGRAEFVKKEFIKPGATVIDVGINFKEDSSRKSGYRMCGDVDFEEAQGVAGAITPVPGGVGPMTVAMLMMNCVNNAKARLKRMSKQKTGVNSYGPTFKKRLEKSPSFAWKFGTSAHEA